MNILKQSTAVDVLIGPFVDSTNAYDAETGLSPAVKLSKNGQALAAKNDLTTPVHDADGYYNCELDATDTNTVGTLRLSVVGSATSLPVFHDYQVIEEAVYDALFGAAADGVPAALSTLLGTPAADLATDIAAVETDTQDIQARLPAALSNGAIDANVARVNDVAVTGVGTAGDPWGP